MVEDDSMISLSKNLLQMKFMRRGDPHNVANNFNAIKDSSNTTHSTLLKSIPSEEHWYFSVSIPNYRASDENVVICDDFKVFDDINTFGRFSINGYNADIQKFTEYHNKDIKDGSTASTGAKLSDDDYMKVISDGEMASRMNAYTNKNFSKPQKSHKNKKNRKRKFRNKNSHNHQPMNNNN